MKNSAILKDFIEYGKSESCPIIDMHGHYGPISWIYMPYPYAEEMLASMSRQGVKALVFSSHNALVEGEVEQGNDLAADVVSKYPGSFFAYEVINPNFPELIEKQIKNFPKRKGFLGFKFLPDYHSYPITGDIYAPALEYANENNLCVLSHTWGFSPCDGPELVEQVAKKYPNVTIIMGHSGFGQWDKSIAIARDYENAFLELTCVYATHAGISLKWTDYDFGIGVNGIIEKMVEGAGSEKILFGTDLPWYSPHYAAGAILYSKISDDDVHNILHRNAEKIFEKTGVKI